LALAGCETLPAVVISGGDTFDVRYDAAAHTPAQADAKAREHCGGAAELVSQETRFDGFAYRTYRCVGS
jgi:hypothetical protein